MSQGVYTPGVTYEDRAAGPSVATRGFHLFGQLIGILLIVAGAYYALSVVSAGIHIIRQPGDLANALEPFAKTMNLEKAIVTVGKNDIPIGRAAAGIFLLMWYLMTTIIALKVVTAGGQLIMGFRQSQPIKR